MLRSFILSALLLAMAGAASAQQYVPDAPRPTTGAWPGGSGAGSEVTVTSRSWGSAPAAVVFRGRLGISRRAPTQEEAAQALDDLIAQIKAMDGPVTVRAVRKDGGRYFFEQAPPTPSVIGPPRAPNPSTPPLRVWQESATIELDAPSRAAISTWSAKAPPAQSPVSANSTILPPTPILTEQANDDDPAWAVATKNALTLAERDARMAAQASGGDLGRLESMWVERSAYATGGQVQVQVTAEYQIVRGRR